MTLLVFMFQCKNFYSDQLFLSHKKYLSPWKLLNLRGLCCFVWIAACISYIRVTFTV